MAAELKAKLGIDAALEVGSSGEFSIWVDGDKVLEKTGWSFPDPSKVVNAVLSKQGTPAPK